MSCSHGWHGCGPWYGSPHGRGWYEPVDWDDEIGPPVRRGARRYLRTDQETGTAELEGRLEELRAEVRRVAAELASLRGAP